MQLLIQFLFLSGFLLLKKVLGERAFFRQGHPKVFITDNSDPMRKALKTVWPDSEQFLCVFHILQQVWRWVLYLIGICFVDVILVMYLYAVDINGNSSRLR